jgi:hypothetical protein
MSADGDDELGGRGEELDRERKFTGLSALWTSAGTTAGRMVIKGVAKFSSFRRLPLERQILTLPMCIRLDKTLMTRALCSSIRR